MFLAGRFWKIYVGMPTLTSSFCIEWIVIVKNYCDELLNTGCQHHANSFGGIPVELFWVCKRSQSLAVSSHIVEGTLGLAD